MSKCLGHWLLVLLIMLLAWPGRAAAQDEQDTAPAPVLRIRLVDQAGSDVAAASGVNRTVPSGSVRVVLSVETGSGADTQIRTFWLEENEVSPPVLMARHLSGRSMTVVVTQFTRHATQTTTVTDLLVPYSDAYLSIALPEAPDVGLRDRGAKAAATILGVGNGGAVDGSPAVVEGASVLVTLAEPEAALDVRIEVDGSSTPVLEIATPAKRIRIPSSQFCRVAAGRSRTAYCFRAAGFGVGEAVTMRLVGGDRATDVGRYELGAGMNTVRVRVPG